MSYGDNSLERRAMDAVPEPARGTVRFVVEWLPILLVALGWEYASGNFVSEAILPPVSDTLAVVVNIVVTGQILPHLGISLLRIALGLGASIVVGVLLGVSMARSDSIENFFDIFLTLLYPIPKTALVPLAILWLGTGTKTAVLIVFLACLLPIVLNSYNAAQTVDQNLVRSARMMGTDGWHMLRKVIIPDTIPEILTGIRQAIPFAFIALVSAEFIAADTGVGARILSHGQFGNYDSMFAVIIVISATAYFTVRGFEIAKERSIAWT